MRNKMKMWRRFASTLKQVAIKHGFHTKGVRYGRVNRVPNAQPQWKGGRPLPILASPLLMAMLKDNGHTPEPKQYTD